MPAKLEEYNRKRNFEKTGEPEGNAEQPEECLRFVVQHHMARRDHYDFRLEWNGALLSWAVPKGPSYDTRDKRLAVQVEDHPLEYRNFEGTIPKGEYGGGAVMLWDEGTWESQTDMDEGLRTGALKFVLYGKRLKGKWALVRMKAKPGETKSNWLLLKEKDAYTQTGDGISAFATSVRTGRTMAEIEAGAADKVAKNPFDKTGVQLAKLVKTAPEGEDWLYELKYDGYRILAYLEGGSVRLVTRNGNDDTGRFQPAADALADWAGGRAMVLDGEMAITDAAGRTDFQALQNYMKNPQGKNLTYIVFDLLALDGTDLRGRPLTERKETLETLMAGAPKSLYYSSHVRGGGKESFGAACQAGLEGIVGKKADSVYSGTRNGDWIKLKCDTRQEFVIGGYTLTDKKTSGVSALLLGVYEGTEFIFAGRAGTGLTGRSMTELEEKFQSLQRETPPFKEAPAPRKNEKVTWLEPRLVAEIKFAEWTKDNLLRQASFKGLRADKDPVDIKKEDADDAAQPPAREAEKSMKASGDSITIDGVRISSPGKVLFEDPVVTKEDVVRYYAAVAARMLPYVSQRILSIVRCPKGISQSCFYKKHPGPDNKGIVTIPILTSGGETEEYFYIENAAGLLFEAQMGTLEFHTWGSRVDMLEKPDIMVFDLDPDEGMALDRVRQGVRDLRSLLDQLSLTSYLKTSGGKGYHVVVPFQPSVQWDAFHDFARHTAEAMEQQWPDRYTSNVRKDKRKNRIFIDWIRNGRGATSIAPYAIRARKGAKVSMPIAWEELDTVAPDGVTMGDALKRIGRSDPWQNFFQTVQRLK
ncbi:ATP-dependent DNA ligase LigD phosphoesterase module /ATP-dependent DNA ligase LigD polymerase module [Sporobacter termitidis DSM 10068]|uniref:DNA ligase (ATP) n=1 Tax=Sporobacter termitidis DSM 10068 TaxID=1123282 RepID=A0A1M5ZEH0_9FIRM|nr:DNA ligase D [Sporobacter termitidis]SHI22627.1 ATP-dependent DNA ligase LigD phosphoesterase module /ATP-dependent DNA ligase LigD polymerase module [Sporobacter termitidis DSM 10068]